MEPGPPAKIAGHLSTLGGVPPPPVLPSARSTSLKRPISILKKYNPMTGSVDRVNCLTRSSLPTMSTSTSAMTSRSVVMEKGRGFPGTSNTENREKSAPKSTAQPAPVLIPKISGSENSMRKLLDNLHSSRIQIEEDQRAYEKCRRSVERVDKKTFQARQDLYKLREVFQSQTIELASKMAELKSADLRNRVVEKGVKELGGELNSASEELCKLRSEISALSSAFLTESLQFAMRWNCTDLGRKFRSEYLQAEKEHLEQEKRQLEIELEDFLSLKRGTEECAQEKKQLQQRYKEHNEAASKEEKELQKEIDELDMAMMDLEREENELKKAFDDESEEMKCQIEEVQDSITALQVSTKNAQAVAETQKNITVATASHLARKGGKSALGIKNDNNYANRNSWSNKGNEAQNRFGKSEASVKPYVNINTSNNGKDGTYAVSTTNSNSADSEGDGFSNSNDEDICMAAAMEVSQSLKVRSYEPMTPTPSYAPPLKVRVVERPQSAQFQTSITSFMKPVTRTPLKVRVVERPKSPQIQMSIMSFMKPVTRAPSKYPMKSSLSMNQTPTRPNNYSNFNKPSITQPTTFNQIQTRPSNYNTSPITQPTTLKQPQTRPGNYNNYNAASFTQVTNPPRKNFQFKKKNPNQNEAANSLNGSTFTSSSIHYSPTCGRAGDSINENRVELFADKPFSSFTSSRLFLSDSQVDRLL